MAPNTGATPKTAGRSKAGDLGGINGVGKSGLGLRSYPRGTLQSRLPSLGPNDRQYLEAARYPRAAAHVRQQPTSTIPRPGFKKKAVVGHLGIRVQIPAIGSQKCFRTRAFPRSQVIVHHFGMIVASHIRPAARIASLRQFPSSTFTGVSSVPTTFELST